MDRTRIDALWRICGERPALSRQARPLQEYILWRRVAGGLSAERQERCWRREKERCSSKKTPRPS